MNKDHIQPEFVLVITGRAFISDDVSSALTHTVSKYCGVMPVSERLGDVALEYGLDRNYNGLVTALEEHYGYSTARNKGTCDNRLSIRRDVIEASVLDGLKDHLLPPDCVKEFVTEFHKEMNRLAATQDTERDRLTRDLVKTENDIKKLIEAIKEGVPGSAIKDEMETLEDRRQELTYALEHAPAQ